MAEILPFRAWRYNNDFTSQIGELTSPLFDVVSEKQLRALYANPINSIHLSVPEMPDGAARAARTLQAWKAQGILKQDQLPGIYVYYQYFKIPGIKEEHCRKGFTCHIRTYRWEDKVILRHENTIPDAVNDRIAMLRETGLHASPTHGLYTDEDKLLEGYLDEAIQHPIYETEDYQGVRDVLSVIHDATVIERFVQVLADKQVILADGHHRYESSLKNLDYFSKLYPELGMKAGYHYHLMYLTNTSANPLRILPTHRLIKEITNFDLGEVIDGVKQYFDVHPVVDSETIDEVIAGKRWTFGLLSGDSAYAIRLKPELVKEIAWPFPDVVKALDLTVLHYFVIEKVLGIPGPKQRASTHIGYDRSFSDCLKKVVTQQVDMALITNEISIEEVRAVCASGYTMPQKSTYFYPKVVCGFVFSSIIESEFQLPHYGPFERSNQ